MTALEKKLTPDDLARPAKKKEYGRCLTIEGRGRAAVNWRWLKRDIWYDG